MRTSHSSSLEHSMQMSSKLSASEEGILSRQFPGRQSPFLSSSMVFNSPISTTDSSTSQKITVIQEAPFLVTTVSSVSLPVNVPSVGNTLLKDCKYQCQQCASTGNEFKHLRESHGAVTLSPSRYRIID
uniref:C2H2-type domain-containing protein n=1 Tax=Meloidogyne javanica TaxID=6303 RepID=A0A915LKC7_MELJA